MAEVITSDDENDGGGAKSHLFLGTGHVAGRPGHDNGPDWMLSWSQRTIFEATLQPGGPKAQQLQQTASELWMKIKKHNMMQIFSVCLSVCKKYRKKILFCFCFNQFYISIRIL